MIAHMKNKKRKILTIEEIYKDKSRDVVTKEIDGIQKNMSEKKLKRKFARLICHLMFVIHMNIHLHTKYSREVTRSSCVVILCEYILQYFQELFYLLSF